MRQKMPPPATELPVEGVWEGTTPGASGVPRATLPVRVELRTVKFPKLLIPPPCPEPKLSLPSPPAAPMAALPLSVQPVTVRVAPTRLESLSAPPPALAPGLPPTASFSVNVLLVIVAGPVLAKETSMAPPRAMM